MGKTPDLAVASPFRKETPAKGLSREGETPFSRNPWEGDSKKEESACEDWRLELEEGGKLPRK